MTWRVSRKVGRTIYLVEDDEKPNQEPIGMMDNRYFAELAVNSVNEITTLMGFLNHQLEVGVPPGESTDTVAIDLLRQHYNPAVYMHKFWPWWLCPRCTQKRRRIRDY